MDHNYTWGGSSRGRTHMFTTADWAQPGSDHTVTQMFGHIEANRIIIPPDAQINTSIYEEAEVVYE